MEERNRKKKVIQKMLKKNYNFLMKCFKEHDITKIKKPDKIAYVIEGQRGIKPLKDSYSLNRYLVYRAGRKFNICEFDKIEESYKSFEYISMYESWGDTDVCFEGNYISYLYTEGYKLVEGKELSEVLYKKCREEMDYFKWGFSNSFDEYPVDFEKYKLYIKTQIENLYFKETVMLKCNCDSYNLCFKCKDKKHYCDAVKKFNFMDEDVDATNLIYEFIG